MAEPQEPFPGADGIRSLKDQDSIFRAFDSYPWTKDAAFLSGLRAILGPPNPSSSPSSSSQRGSLRDIATHARIFYYAQRIGVHIDFSAYQAWLARHPDHITPHIVPPEYEQEPAASPTLASSPSSSSSSAAAAAAAQSTTSPTAAATAQAEATPWQQAAPKADLYVQRNKPSSSNSHPQSSSSASSEPEPAYPIAFAEMIKLLQEGKPIPGIRQIPNTIERDPTVKPVGSRPVPKKPWEREASATAEAGSGFGENTLDLEFPPVEQVATAATQS